MAFIATCPHCSARFSVTTYVGASYACSRCYNSFLAYPDDHPDRPGPRPPKPPAPAEHPAETNSKTAEKQSAPAKPVEEAAPASRRVEAEPKPKRPRLTAQVNLDIDMPAAPRPTLAPASLAGWINAPAVIALILGGASLCLTGFGILWWVSVTLAAVALLVVGGGMVFSANRTANRIWLRTAGLICLAALLVVCVRPEWLNPRWALDVAVAPPDEKQIFVVDANSQMVLRPVEKDEVVNGMLHGIKQGDMVLTVEEARVAPHSFGEPTDKAPPLHLLLSIKVANVGHLHRIQYHPQADGGPKVRDQNGRAYAFIPGPDSSKKRVLDPGEFFEDTLVFAAAPGGSALDLELTGAMWSGHGVCQMRVPREMIAVVK